MTRISLALAAILLLSNCAELTEAETAATFPAISTETAAEWAFSECGDFPADRNQFSRAPAFAEFDGFAGHIVQICSGSRASATLVFWSKTDATFSRITARITTLDGREIPFTGSTYDPGLGITTFSFTALGQSCDIVKPRTGISPSPFAVC